VYPMIDDWDQCVKVDDEALKRVHSDNR
jgi:hypothetical protein